MTAKGWWRVSLRMDTLRRLEDLRDRLQQDDGGRMSIDAVVSHIISDYYRSRRS